MKLKVFITLSIALVAVIVVSVFASLKDRLAESQRYILNSGKDHVNNLLDSLGYSSFHPAELKFEIIDDKAPLNGILSRSKAFDASYLFFANIGDKSKFDAISNNIDDSRKQILPLLSKEELLEIKTKTELNSSFPLRFSNESKHLELNSFLISGISPNGSLICVLIRHNGNQYVLFNQLNPKGSLNLADLMNILDRLLN